MFITTMKLEIRLTAKSYYLMLKEAHICHGTKMIKELLSEREGHLAPSPFTLAAGWHVELAMGHLGHAGENYTSSDDRTARLEEPMSLGPWNLHAASDCLHPNCYFKEE